MLVAEFVSVEVALLRVDVGFKVPLCDHGVVTSVLVGIGFDEMPVLVIADVVLSVAVESVVDTTVEDVVSVRVPLSVQLDELTGLLGRDVIVLEVNVGLLVAVGDEDHGREDIVPVVLSLKPVEVWEAVTVDVTVETG